MPELHHGSRCRSPRASPTQTRILCRCKRAVAAFAERRASLLPIGDLQHASFFPLSIATITRNCDATIFMTTLWPRRAIVIDDVATTDPHMMLPSRKSTLMPQWEYLVIDLSDLPRRTDEIDLLNDAGVNGWELVGITTNNKAYLKRQFAEPSAPSTMPPRRKKSKTNDAD